VRLLDGPGQCYALGDIQRLAADGDTLRVVTAGATDAFALESIEGVGFHMDAWTGIDDPGLAEDAIPARQLLQNSPNPFSPETRIAYVLPRHGRAELRIYSVNGRLVRTLTDREEAAGRHSVVWDALDETGRPVVSGVYFYELSAPGVEERRKMLVIR